MQSNKSLSTLSKKIQVYNKNEKKNSIKYSNELKHKILLV
jgi:hypothetical protein